MMPKLSNYFETQAYKDFLQEVKSYLKEDYAKGAVDLNALRLKNYWQIGRRFHRLQKRLADLKNLSPTSPTLQRMAKDLRVGASTLYRIMIFYNAWPSEVPLGPEKSALSWAHHVELLGVDSEKARRYYCEQSALHDWSRDTLRQAIKLKLFEQVQSTGRHGQIPELKSPFYTYAAQALRVLDGDTLTVKVDLGFHMSFEPILRLRGVNTPELHADPTGRAAKAKARLEELLKPLPFVVIKSYKTDVYGRYLVDIYYHPTLQEKEAILKQGVFLNQQILDEGLGEWLVM